MPADFNDPNVIKFFKEKYDQENVKRVGWFIKNLDRLKKEATQAEGYKDYRVKDILKAQFNICMPMLARHHLVSRSNRRKKVSADGPVLGIAKDSAAQPTKLMKPVDAAERNILYEPKPSGGLRQYLNVRKRKIPEEKYYFCETSSNVIGWQWKDSAIPCRAPKYGRHNTLLHEASRSGPQPDPPHYV